jgi:hypothetical protein
MRRGERCAKWPLMPSRTLAIQITDGRIEGEKREKVKISKSLIFKGQTKFNS